MRIALVGSFWQFSLEESYARAFTALGHQVLRFDFDEHYRSVFFAKYRPTEVLLRREIARRSSLWLRNVLIEAKPDLLLVFKGRFILPEHLLAIKSALTDTQLLNFNPDSPWEKANSTNWLLDSLPIYDLHLSWSKQLLAKFTGANAKRVEYLPFAYDPAIHQPVADEDLAEFDAVLVGTYDPTREKILADLGEFNIAIWGNDWNRATQIPKGWLKGSAVYGKDSARLLKRGMVALNFLRPQNIGSHNMRTFEIPATATTMLTDRTPEHLAFFDEGSEIECFEGLEELKLKLRQLSQGMKKVNYGRNAYVRIQDETYEKRAARIIRLL